MVTPVAAAAVVAKNARLFIVISLEMFFRTSTELYSNSSTVVRMLGTVARTELAAEPFPLAMLPTADPYTMEGAHLVHP
jgi:hypothetical protein